MTWTLLIADRAYSSWSLRGWLIFHRFGIPLTLERTRMYTDDFRSATAMYGPARTVPAARGPDGAVLWDSLAIVEELAARYPEAGLWPADPVLRAAGRSAAAEMHSGFHALREACVMNLRVAYEPTAQAPGVLADMARIEAVWAYLREVSGSDGWLLGAYSAVDAFFAPVATRVATYGLPVGPAAGAYVAAHLADPAFRQWRAMALVDGPDQEGYDRPYPRGDWPGPVARQARAAEIGPSENAACPYSGKPVTHFLETEGRIFGFCNPFCRDKTVADPDAWPAFTALLERSC